MSDDEDDDIIFTLSVGASNTKLSDKMLTSKNPFQVCFAVIACLSVLVIVVIILIKKLFM